MQFPRPEFRERTTDRFDVAMLIMTALCCSIALVSCGKTAKSRDAEKRAQEVAEQQKIQAAEKAKTEKAAADQKAKEDALKAQEEAEKKRKLGQQAGTTPAPAASPLPNPGVIPPLPVGVPVPGAKDGKDPKDNKNGTPQPVAGVPGPVGPAGRDGAPGAPGAPGKDATGGGTAQGVIVPVVPVNGQAGAAGNSGGSTSIPPAARESAALQVDFESEALNLLDLGQAEATWIGCTVTAETASQPPANQQAVKERFVVEKSAAFHRTRQLHQGSDCATPLAGAEQLDGKIKIVARESGSTADAITYKIDLRVPGFGSSQTGTGTTTTTPETVYQNLIKIERQSQTLTFGKEAAPGQARPTTLDGGYKLKHN